MLLGSRFFVHLWGWWWAIAGNQDILELQSFANPVLAACFQMLLPKSLNHRRASIPIHIALCIAIMYYGLWVSDATKTLWLTSGLEDRWGTWSSLHQGHLSHIRLSQVSTEIVSSTLQITEHQMFMREYKWKVCKGMNRFCHVICCFANFSTTSEFHDFTIGFSTW